MLPVYTGALTTTFERNLSQLAASRRGELIALIAEKADDENGALRSWAEAFRSALGNGDITIGEDAPDIDSLILAATAFEGMCTFTPKEKRYSRVIGLTPMEFHIVHLVAVSAKPLIISQVCRGVGISLDVGSQAIIKLEKKGFAERRKREDNQRAFDVVLTDAGRELVTQSSGAYVELFDASFPGLAAVDRSPSLAF